MGMYDAFIDVYARDRQLNTGLKGISKIITTFAEDAEEQLILNVVVESQEALAGLNVVQERAAALAADQPTIVPTVENQQALAALENTQATAGETTVALAEVSGAADATGVTMASATPEVEGYSTSLKEVSATADLTAVNFGTASGAVDVFTGSVEAGQGALGKYQLVLGAVAGAVEILGLKTASDIQKADLAYTSVTGSASAAKAVVADLAKSTANTPFALRSVLDPAKILLASHTLGVTRNTVVSDLHTMESAVASVGGGSADIDKITTAIQVMSATGKLGTRQLRQLIAAVPSFDIGKLYANAAKITGEDIGKVQVDLAHGAIPIDEAYKAIITTLKQVPGATDAIKRETDTLGGAFQVLKNDVEESLAGSFEKQLPAVTALIRGAGPVVEILGKDIGALVSGGLVILEQGFQAVRPEVALFVGGLKIAGPIISTVAHGLAAIPAPVLQVGAALYLANAAVDRFGPRLAFTVIGLRDMGAASAATAGEIEVATVATEGLTAATEANAVATEANAVTQEGAFATSGSLLGGLGVAAKQAGGAATGALGGIAEAVNPVTIGFAALTIGGTLLFNKFEKDKQKAKELDESLKAIGKDLAFTQAGAHGADRVQQILDAIKTKGGDAAKAIKDINNSGVSDKDIAYEFTAQSGAIGAVSKSLKEAKKAGDDYANADPYKLTSKAYDDLGNKAKDLSKAYKGTKEAAKDFITVEQAALAEEINQANVVGDKGLAGHFQKISDQLKKDGDVGKAYQDSIQYTDQLIQKQKQQVVATNQVQDAVAAVTESLGATDPDRAFKSLTAPDLSKFYQGYVALADKSQEKASEFVQNIAKSLQVDPDQYGQFAQDLAGFKSQVEDEYGSLISDIQGKFPTLDDVFADKFDVKPGGPSIAALQKNTQTVTKQILDFQHELSDLTAHGFGPLAATIGQQGLQAGGIAAAQAAKLVDQGKTAGVTALQNSFVDYNSALQAGSQSLGTTAEAYLRQKYQLDPSFQVAPDYVLQQDPVKEAALAQQLADAQQRVTDLAAQKADEKSKLQKSTGGRAEANVGNTSDIDAQVATAKANLVAVQKSIDTFNKNTFADLQKQATTAADAVHKSIQNAGIDKEVKKQVADAGKEVKKIPGYVDDSKGSFDQSMKNVFTLREPVKKSIQIYAGALADNLKAAAPNITVTTAKPNAHAAGTDFAPGGLSLLGERGPELAYVPRGTKIWNANQTKQMIDNSRTVNGGSFNFPGITDAASAVSAADNILRLQLAQAGF